MSVVASASTVVSVSRHQHYHHRDASVLTLGQDPAVKSKPAASTTASTAALARSILMRISNPLACARLVFMGFVARLRPIVLATAAALQVHLSRGPLQQSSLS